MAIRNNGPLQLNLPVLSRPAEDLATLAVKINAEHDAGERATRKGLEHFRAAGEALLTAKSQCGHGKWLSWIEKNLKFNRTTAWAYMRVARNWQKCSAAEHLRDALRLLTDSGDEGEDNSGPSLPEYVTLAEWNEAGKEVRARLLKGGGDARFNAQDNENIEWALWSWNPVTGCLHNCPYCYARDIAERFYQQKFEPSLWSGRLAAPRNTPFPAEKAAQWMGHRNVFVCSMADLFGRWVPEEWIEAVLDAATQAKQWNFLFLTKFPNRLAEFAFPKNAWVGTTVDCQARVKNAEESFRKVKAGVKWLSCEPLLEPLRFNDLGAFDWVVIGGSSRSSQTPEFRPPRAWVNDLELAAGKAGCKVYEKANLLDRIRQYPTAAAEEVREAPRALQYLPKDSPKP